MPKIINFVEAIRNSDIESNSNKLKVTAEFAPEDKLPIIESILDERIDAKDLFAVGISDNGDIVDSGGEGFFDIELTYNTDTCDVIAILFLRTKENENDTDCRWRFKQIPLYDEETDAVKKHFGRILNEIDEKTGDLRQALWNDGRLNDGDIDFLADVFRKHLLNNA